MFQKKCDHCLEPIRGWEKEQGPYCSDECEQEAIRESETDYHLKD